MLFFKTHPHSTRTDDLVECTFDWKIREGLTRAAIETATKREAEMRKKYLNSKRRTNYHDECYDAERRSHLAERRSHLAKQFFKDVDNTLLIRSYKCQNDETITNVVFHSKNRKIKLRNQSICSRCLRQHDNGKNRKH